MHDSPEQDRTVDARGLACPLPVIELAKAIEAAPPGSRVQLFATDVAAKVDVPVWCRMKRHPLLTAEEVDGYWRFVVERRG